MNDVVVLPSGFRDWLRGSALAIDTGSQPAMDTLPRLVSAGLAGAGVPVGRGGSGGKVCVISLRRAHAKEMKRYV